MFGGESEEEVMPILKRMDSSRLLCDNYENNELVYSVETLTPKVPKMEFDLMKTL